jgi:hypothetical protein
VTTADLVRPEDIRVIPVELVVRAVAAKDEVAPLITADLLSVAWGRAFARPYESDVV